MEVSRLVPDTVIMSALRNGELFFYQEKRRRHDYTRIRSRRQIIEAYVSTNPYKREYERRRGVICL